MPIASSNYLTEAKKAPGTIMMMAEVFRKEWLSL